MLCRAAICCEIRLTRDGSGIFIVLAFDEVPNVEFYYKNQNVLQNFTVMILSVYCEFFQELTRFFS